MTQQTKIEWTERTCLCSWTSCPERRNVSKRYPFDQFLLGMSTLAVKPLPNILGVLAAVTRYASRNDIRGFCDATISHCNHVIPCCSGFIAVGAEPIKDMCDQIATFDWNRVDTPTSSRSSVTTLFAKIRRCFVEPSGFRVVTALTGSSYHTLKRKPFLATTTPTKPFTALRSSLDQCWSWHFPSASTLATHIASSIGSGSILRKIRDGFLPSAFAASFHGSSTV